LVLFFPGSAETDIERDEMLNDRLMAGCVGNICTKMFLKWIYLLQVTIDNARDVFFSGHDVETMLII